jgi:hypothetical protein
MTNTSIVCGIEDAFVFCRQVSTAEGKLRCTAFAAR